MNSYETKKQKMAHKRVKMLSTNTQKVLLLIDRNRLWDHAFLDNVCLTVPAAFLLHPD